MNIKCVGYQTDKHDEYNFRFLYIKSKIYKTGFDIFLNCAIIFS